MSVITTHILDTSRGRPAEGVEVHLSLQDGDRWVEISRSTTDSDGRVTDLIAPGASLAPGHYRLHFAVGDYFQRLGVAAFFPFAEIVFRVRDSRQHYHVPLILNPFGYSTYRGS